MTQLIPDPKYPNIVSVCASRVDELPINKEDTDRAFSFYLMTCAPNCDADIVHAEMSADDKDYLIMLAAEFCGARTGMATDSTPETSRPLKSDN